MVIFHCYVSSPEDKQITIFPHFQPLRLKAATAAAPGPCAGAAASKAAAPAETSATNTAERAAHGAWLRAGKPSENDGFDHGLIFKHWDLR